MRIMLGLGVLLAAGCCGHGPPMMMMGGGMGEARREAPWPTVRIDEPMGARVTMERGVFGDGLATSAPFQAQFQPTAEVVSVGYPLEFAVDEVAAHRYGAQKALRIYGRLNVAAAYAPSGTLLIAPTECALRALVTGDLDELRVPAEPLPRADEACATAAKGETHEHGGCPMAHGEMAPGACPMHEGGDRCGHAGARGCGKGARHGRAAAILTLRMSKF